MTRTKSGSLTSKSGRTPKITPPSERVRVLRHVLGEEGPAQVERDFDIHLFQTTPGQIVVRFGREVLDGATGEKFWIEGEWTVPCYREEQGTLFGETATLLRFLVDGQTQDVIDELGFADIVEDMI